MADDGVLCYEQPLNERIRTFLRVEHLTARLHHHRRDSALWGRRAAMDALLDILNVMSRHDIRGQVSKELELRRRSLHHLSERDDVDQEALTGILTELDAIASEMAQIPPQFASYQLRLLRDSAEPTTETAENGVLVHNTATGTQMIRVLLDDHSVFPEISGGRHRATVRFMRYQDSQMHLRQTENSIVFRMACCRF